jgi:FtsZ-binding cell division protein ZapB
MANATPTLQAGQAPPQTGVFEDTAFADSAIMDMTTPTVLTQSKPQFGSDQFDSEVNTPSDQPSDALAERLDVLLGSAMSNEEHKHAAQESQSARSLRDGFDTDSNEAGTEADIEVDPELVSHLSTTVSSLRLRHQEQSHLNSLFTSKLEALAQRSIEHEATIRSLTAEVKSLRDSNTQLGRENALLANENKELRFSMQDLKGEIVERERAVEAMTGAVRGLEGWIESASNSPRSNSKGRPLQNRARHRGGDMGVVRGKGRFRGRYYLDDNEDVSLGHDGSADVETAEIQEGVMAWVRGFKDVEEGLKERQQSDGRERGSKRVNGRPSTDPNNHTHDTYDEEEFGDYETGG